MLKENIVKDINGDSGRFDACFIAMNELSTDARTLNLARSLVKFGKKVCVIAYGTVADKEFFENEGIMLFPINPSLAKKAVRRWADFTLSARKYRYNGAANYYFAEDVYSLFIAKELARINDGKIYYDSREIYSALGPLHSSPRKQRLLTKYEDMHIGAVNEIIVSGKLDAEYLRKHFKHDKPYRVIMNLPPYRIAEKKDLIRQKYSIPENMKIIIYQGMLLPGRGLVHFTKALKYLDNHLLFILGEGDYKSLVYEESKLFGVSDRVIFGGKVKYEELFDWTCSADIGASFIQPISLSYSLALPNKLFEYCMAGLPSIVSDIPAQRQILEQYPIGILISPNSTPEQIAAAVKRVAEPNNYEAIHEACIRTAKIYCYESQLENIKSLV